MRGLLDLVVRLFRRRRRLHRSRPPLVWTDRGRLS